MLLFLSKDDLTLRLKAIHNKDYSVVKTFKTGPSGLVFVLLKLLVPEKHCNDFPGRYGVCLVAVATDATAAA